MSNYLVSVIIPTYNSENTLAKCLESIKKQTYNNIETIIVDNFSDDKTIEIAKQYVVKIFQTKAGMSMARNIGVQKIKNSSKYILHIDSDMELMPEVIEQCISLAESKNANIGAIVIPEITVGNSTIAKIRKFERSFYGDTEIEAARFFRKHLFEKVGGYDEDITFSEDRTVPQKIQQLGYDMKARINTEILHHEEHLSLSAHLRKKYKYGKSAGNYIRKYKEYYKTQMSPLYRASIFLKNRRFYSRPFLAIAVLILKLLEFFSVGLGYLVEKIRNWYGIFQMNVKSIFEKLDLYLSIFLLVSSSLLLSSYIYFIGFNVKIVTCMMSILIGSITYLFIRDRKQPKKQPFIKQPKTFRLLLNISFTLLMTISFLLLIKDLYVRPLSYFISISFLSVLIFLETEVSNYKLILPKILLLSANLRIGLLYKFPSITGGDGAYHYGLIKAALLTGDMVGNTEFFYSEYPIPHINALVHMLVAGVNYKNALTTSWAVSLSLISVFFVFLIGRELFNEKIGLISSLLITLFPFDIWHSYQLAPMTFATALIPLMLYLFVIRKSKNHFRLGIVTLIIISYSHPLVMVEILIIGFGLFIGSLVCRINDKNSRIFPFAHILIIFSTRWIYFSRSLWIRKIVNNISNLYHLTILIIKIPSSSLALEYVAGNLSRSDEILNTLGFSIFLCVSVIGILFIISRKSTIYCGTLNQFRTQKIEILFATILFAVIVFGFSSIGVGVLPYRWFGPMGTLLAIPAAIGIQKGLVKKSVSATIMFILAFFMITNSIVNIDSPIYAKEDTIRWAFTQSEMSATDWSFQKANGILTDSVAYLRSLQFRYETPQTSSDDGVILIRDYILEHAFYKGKKYFLNIKFDKNVINIKPSEISMLNDQEKNTISNLNQTFSKVYENGNVKAYYQNPLQWIDEET